MTKAQNYLLHMVSQIPSNESPLNALLTRQNIESINEQMTQTIQNVKEHIRDLNERISRFILNVNILISQGESIVRGIPRNIHSIKRTTFFPPNKIPTNIIPISRVSLPQFLKFIIVNYPIKKQN